MSNTVAIEFAGDSAKLEKAAARSDKAVTDVGKSVTSASDDFKKSATESSNFTDKIGKLGAGVSGMTDAIDSAGAATQALSDLQQAGAQRAQRLARANNDVAQAQEDYNQALRDGSQATIDSGQAEVDLKQARLDQSTTLKAYNAAVKEFGAGSDEARQAQVDMAQAGVDVKQAQEDSAQATRDASQANIDAKGAQLDLNDAMTEAHPPELQQWADKINMVAPILSGLVGIVGLVTAAQWAWNAAQLASPLTWIVVAIGAVVVIIVLLVKHWDWVKRVGTAAWNGIKEGASSAWNFLKKIPGWTASAFKGLASFITLPYRTAFNFIASAWNNTVGRLSWTVPGWIPGIGGNSISVPHIPRFHSGVDSVPGAPGSEMLAILQAGERVTPANGGGGGGDAVTVIVKLNDDVLIEGTARGVRRRGGNVQFVLGGRNA